ncbi:MAG: glycosyltransferase family protein [Caulobacteraceae bacterium]|nr:glycosyltransferase family protein [Caulobacteraceae bacterium]
MSKQIAELAQLGKTIFDQGKTAEADGIFASLLEIAPQDKDLLRGLGIFYAERGRCRQAEGLLRALLQESEDDAVSCNVLAVCLLQLGNAEDSLLWADKALAIDQTLDDAHNSRGNALNRLGRHEAAIEAFRASLSVRPRDPVVLINMANALRDLGRCEEALGVIDQALALDRSIAVAHSNRGNLLQDLGRPQEALLSYHRAIALNPNFAEPHQHRGNVLIGLGRYDEAIRSFDAALALNPNLARAHLNRSHCNLLLGRYEEGWREYEWRWLGSPVPTTRREFSVPQWLGREALTGRTILIHCEQGLGDCIQFARYIPRVAALGARVIVEAYPPLVALFRSLEGVDEVIEWRGPVPSVDFHCPLLSLPLALGGQIPAEVPYLHARAEQVAAWRARLSASGMRVGLVASGAAIHQNDHNRSLPLEQLVTALPEGPAYVLLQKDVRDADMAFARTRPDIAVLSDHIGDFTDTAAICEALDLIISVDTSVAHLAGALGRPLWMLIPFDPDWRWGLGVETSAWYPSAKLFRQPEQEDWAEPLGRLGAELCGLAHS